MGHLKKILTGYMPSLLILKYFNKFNGERVTFAGTCSEYDLNYGFCSENVTPDRPRTLYSMCKNSLRQVSESFCAQNDISFSGKDILLIWTTRTSITTCAFSHNIAS